MKVTKRQLRKLIKETLNGNFVSHTREPDVGDMVINDNPSCKHYGSKGIVLRVAELPGDIGKTATYRCTNNGDSWQAGDVLEKTMDQLRGI